jgi:hypothetical protein
MAAAVPAWGRSGSRRIWRRILPGHIVTDGRPGAVSAAPFGSASILPISWAYCLMMGGEGPDPGDQDRDPERQLHRSPAEGRL